MDWALLQLVLMTSSHEKLSSAKVAAVGGPDAGRCGTLLQVERLWSHCLVDALVSEC